MQVKNKQTGAVEFMRHGPATDAVTAGTHEFVNDEPGTVQQPASDADASTKDADLGAMTKDELLAEAAKRGIDIKAGATKAEIVDALSAA